MTSFHNRATGAPDPPPGNQDEMDVRRTPSQAEGERELFEEDSEEEYRTSEDVGDITYTPSQAEGDLETIERDLAQKRGD